MCLQMISLNMKEFIERRLRDAGAFLMDHFRKDPGLWHSRSTAKEAITVYDKQVDDLIIGGIRAGYPDHGILTEESGFMPGDPEWLWIVDSLDGTGNYANWNPFFCICIAVVRKGLLHLGGVYAPALDEMYMAEKGAGAYFNGRRMSVSSLADLQHSYVLYCEGGERDRMRTGSGLADVYQRVTDIRKLGSAGLESAWVAAGRSDAYFTTAIEPWDVAPGVLLVEEAGGRVTDYDGRPWTVERKDLLFSNGMLHVPLLDLLRGTRDTGQAMT